MIHFMQIIKMLNKEQRNLFINLLDDLSYEIEEMGYTHLEDQMELINEMMDNHFSIFMESDSQLKMFTTYILKNQGKLEGAVKRTMLYMDR